MLVHHFCISGFTQHIGRQNGVLTLAEKLIAAGHNENTRSRVHYRQWRANWRAEADHLAGLAAMYGERTQVSIYAYSWGAGWGAIQLSRRLAAVGLEVRAAVLCDPVYRHPRVWRRWLALLSREHWMAPTIRIPHNVREVWSFHQSTNRPQGHRLLPLNGTMIHPSVRLSRAHAAMDDAPEFHARATMVADLVRTEAISGI